MSAIISILIVTHNRSAILARTLDLLKKIDRPASAQLELIVVANVCTDDTVEMVRRIAPTMPYPTRCVEEKNIGVAYARNRALLESRGDLLVYVDDDVFVDRQWLSGLLQTFEQRPEADIVAGKLILCWDAVKRPDWMTSRSEYLLSCIDYGEEILELHRGGQAVTANFAMRRRVVDTIGKFSIGLGRTGDAVLAGEDTDFFARALRAGFRMFYTPAAGARHWVAPHRITSQYLGSAAYGNGLARPFLYPEFSLGFGLLQLAKYGFKYIVYTLITPECKMLGKRVYINNLIRARTAKGIVRGTLRRLSMKKEPQEPETQSVCQVP